MDREIERRLKIYLRKQIETERRKRHPWYMRRDNWWDFLVATGIIGKA